MDFLPATVTPPQQPMGAPQQMSPLAAALMGRQPMQQMQNPLGTIPLSTIAQMMAMRSGQPSPYGTSNANDPYAGMAGLTPDTMIRIQASAAPFSNYTPPFAAQGGPTY